MQAAAACGPAASTGACTHQWTLPPGMRRYASQRDAHFVCETCLGVGGRGVAHVVSDACAFPRLGLAQCERSLHPGSQQPRLAVAHQNTS